MNIKDLYHEINSKSTDWDVSLYTELRDDDTIFITVPGNPNMFKISQDRFIPDLFSGGFCWKKDGTSIGVVHPYDGEGKTAKAVAQEIINDAQWGLGD